MRREAPDGQRTMEGGDKTMFASADHARREGEEDGRKAGELAAEQEEGLLQEWEAGFREGFEQAAGRPPADEEIEAQRPAAESEDELGG